jgi:hypothetical protein
LEKNWEMALRRVRDLEAWQPAERSSDIEADPGAFANLADNLSAAWNAPDVTMRARQQLLRTLVADIIVDADDATSCSRSLAWRAALRAARPQTTLGRTWLCEDRGRAGRHTQHGRALVRRTYRRVAQPDGHAYRQGRRGRRIASIRFVESATSMLTGLPRKMANG